MLPVQVIHAWPVQAQVGNVRADLRPAGRWEVAQPDHSINRPCRIWRLALLGLIARGLLFEMPHPDGDEHREVKVCPYRVFG
jgi:hypothetical protein